MASGTPSSGPLRAAEPEPGAPGGGEGGVWHSTCGYAECVGPARYAADSTCAGCRRINYCTRECQKADWKRHKAACKADAAADAAAGREGTLLAMPSARPPPPDPQPLISAASVGDVKRVEELLRLGADVNAADEYGFTPLIVAAQSGHEAVVDALLASPGVSMNAADIDGNTALHHASQGGHAWVVAALSHAPGVAINASNPPDGWTPLHFASKNDQALVVGVLLACMQYLNSLPALVTIFYYYYGWALGAASGINVNAAATDGATPLHLASQLDLATIAATLLTVPDIAVNATTTSGATPLCVAANANQTVVVNLLLRASGVAVNAASDDAGWTPLHAASRAGHVVVVLALLDHPSVDVNPRDFIDGSTPMRLALVRGHLGVAALLEARGGVV